MAKSKRRVVDAKSDSKGVTTHVKLSGNKTWTPEETARKMADRGDLENAHVSKTKGGKSYLRTNPDNKTGNNLDEMSGDT